MYQLGHPYFFPKIIMEGPPQPAAEIYHKVTFRHFSAILTGKTEEFKKHNFSQLQHGYLETNNGAIIAEA